MSSTKRKLSSTVLALVSVGLFAASCGEEKKEEPTRVYATVNTSNEMVTSTTKKAPADFSLTKLASCNLSEDKALRVRIESHDSPYFLDFKVTGVSGSGSVYTCSQSEGNSNASNASADFNTCYVKAGIPGDVSSEVITYNTYREAEVTVKPSSPFTYDGVCTVTLSSSETGKAKGNIKCAKMVQSHIGTQQRLPIDSAYTVDVNADFNCAP